MIFSSLAKKCLGVITASTLCASIAFQANATVVFVETSMGNFEINLLDEQTPETVANFLDYVRTQSYDNAIIHRSINGFITQTGGFTWSIEEQEINTVASFGSITNEPVYSNVRGTIAMAKLGDDPNSATSQWFINLGDNSANLDHQNGGFTVFGVVMGNGMEVVDSIAQLPTDGEIPLHSTPAEDEPYNENHWVLIESVTVTDPNTVTNPSLEPPVSTRDSSSGGSLGVWSLLLLLLPTLWRRAK